MIRVFVYGTLRSDGPQSGLLRGAPRHRARVRGALFDLPAGYPALVPGGEQWVHGEVAELADPRLLALLDAYEGVDEGLYRRVEVSAVIGLRAVKAQAWVMDDPVGHGGRRIASGWWRAQRRR